MKKVMFFLSLAFMLTQGFAQEKLNKLSVNPIQLLGFDIMNIEYERGFIDGKLGVSFYYGRTGSATPTIGDYRFYVSEQNVTIKGYLRSISKSSFWYGGQVSVASANVYYDFDSSKPFDQVEYEKYQNNRATNIGTLGLTGKIGYQFIVRSFYIDVYGGLGYALTNNLFGNAVYKGDLEETNRLLIYGVKMGLAF